MPCDFISCCVVSCTHITLFRQDLDAQGEAMLVHGMPAA